MQQPITTVLVGSGFIANSKGYIVTNAHVVDTSTENVRDLVWKHYSTQLYDKLYQSMAADTSQEDISYYHKKLLEFVSANGSIDNLTYQIAVFNPNQKEGTYEDFIKKGFQAQIKKVGQPYPAMGKDVAVLKIDKEGFPGLTLGSTKKLRPESQIYVLGYPAIADINESGITQPTFTSGIVSAYKKSSQGDYDVIQIDANSSGGNSGGPAFNDRGEIVGIATFGSDVKEGYNWILPVEFAKEFLDELNVKYAVGNDK
ncbi:MAG: serine protease [bacterium]|nr:serine protease [bacterium]